MRCHLLPKKSGGFRRIYVPSDAEMARLRSYLWTLHQYQNAASPGMVSHGFVLGRSPVTNAMFHRGYRFTLSLDMASWFDTVTPKHLEHTSLSGIMSNWVSELFVDGIAGQGLPTSPLVANIAAGPMDWSIFSRRRGWVYTRYADDLTISADSMDAIRHAEGVVADAVADRGWQLAEGKRRIQCSDAGRRIITGVAVDDEVHPTRKQRRMYRAALHQKNQGRAAGRLGWIRLCEGRTPLGFQLATEEAENVFRITTDAMWDALER